MPDTWCFSLLTETDASARLLLSQILHDKENQKQRLAVSAVLAEYTNVNS